MQKKRPDKIDHYYNRAKVVAERSTCLRRKVGAVIIKDEVEVSSGYSGSPRGTPNCIDQEKCLRIDLGVPSGQRYELCRSVHAEQNAIINAARMGISIKGGEIYISSQKIKNKYKNSSRQSKNFYEPCMMCKKEIINAGLVSVHMREEGEGTKTHTIEDIMKELEEETSKIITSFSTNKK